MNALTEKKEELERSKKAIDAWREKGLIDKKRAKALRKTVEELSK